MHRTIRPFELLEPETVEGAISSLSMYGTKAKVLAGGVDLVSKMMRWQVKPEYVVSIRRIPGLDYILINEEGGLRIGALTTLRSIEMSPVIRKDYHVLYEAVNQIASIQIKTMSTAVGNLCVATPASDVATALCVLSIKLKVNGPSQENIVPIEEFFVNVGMTILKPNQIVTEIIVPSVPRESSGAFMKLKPVKASISKVNVAVMLRLVNGICEDVRIALGAVAPTVIRAVRAEGILRGTKIDQKTLNTAAKTAVDESKPITDLRSNAEYRQEMVRVLVQRAILRALDRAKGKELESKV